MADEVGYLLNMDGLRTAHKNGTYYIDLPQYNINILCVQEPHIRGTGRMDYSGSKNSSDHVSWDNSEEGTTYCQGYTGTGAYPITYILCSILFAKTAL